MIDRTMLTADLKAKVAALVDDLRDRATTVDEVVDIVEREWKQAQGAGRTALDLPAWREGLLAQVAVAWVLATVFLRFCEDNGLLPQPVLSGEGERRRRAETAQTMWFRDHPADGERAYVCAVIEGAAKLPGLGHVFETHNPMWLFGPSDDAVRDLLAYWREVDLATGDLRRDFADDAWDTRFLGDLYQDLSEHARKQYALLQTPVFIEEFILDRTLDPALDEFGLEGFRLIDPACGSGHFLLGAFDRLLARWRERAPHEGDRALAERALRSVHGVDLNPFAAAIARFRLLVAALRAAEVSTLAEAPNFTLNIAVGDSLLHGPPPGQQVLVDINEGADPASRHLYATEDRETIDRILSARYHAVVANPPYITGDDRAARDAYKRRYLTCYGEYSLAVPFMERLFDLAVRGIGGASAGFVGQITTNAFMKRRWGAKVVESHLANEVDLTDVVDTSNVPWSGVATIILIGRNRTPLNHTVRGVLSNRGEPSRTDDPAAGHVWRSIVELGGLPGAENEYVTVTELPRGLLSKHPWTLRGGGTTDLKALVDRSSNRLGRVITDSGARVLTRMDEVFEATPGSIRRRGSAANSPFLVGADVRDWSATPSSEVLFPYEASRYRPSLDGNGIRILWPYLTLLRIRRAFGKTQLERGLNWFEHSMLFARRFVPCIIFSDTGTHNHFALDAQVFPSNSHAPVLVPDTRAKETPIELLAYLNSAIACFWIKQVFHTKGAQGVDQGRKEEPWQHDYELGVTQLKEFPLPDGSARLIGERLDGLARRLVSCIPTALGMDKNPTRATLDAARDRATHIREEMVAAQEELDWRCLHLYGVTDDDLSLPPETLPPIAKGERAFEIVLARRVAAGDVTTSWFERHGSTPITEIPAHWPDDYRSMVERRIELITSDRFVGLVERPEYKRRWNWDDWADLEAEALRTWLLDRLEDGRYWPTPQPRSAAQLADDARTDSDFVQVAELYAGRVDVDLTDLVARLVTDESVAYLAAHRYTASGLRTRHEWERTWDLQRREDAGEDVGTIPVPPKYAKVDFAAAAGWKLRGKLDVPKERFIAYPGAGRDADPTPLVGWAGWDHLESAQALAALYELRRTVDGWDAERLTPLLAGVAELVPWLRQWHNDPDPATNTRLGDFFADFVSTEAHTLGVSPHDLSAWRPPKRTGGRKRSRM